VPDARPLAVPPAAAAAAARPEGSGTVLPPFTRPDVPDTHQRARALACLRPPISCNAPAIARVFLPGRRLPRGSVLGAGDFYASVYFISGRTETSTSGAPLVVSRQYIKKASGKPSVGYAESVEEALCFGWIDSHK